MRQSCLEFFRGFLRCEIGDGDAVASGLEEEDDAGHGGHGGGLAGTQFPQLEQLEGEEEAAAPGQILGVLGVEEHGIRQFDGNGGGHSVTLPEPPRFANPNQPPHGTRPMTWFLIALVGPLLWSLCNQIDKFFLGRWFAQETLGALMIFSSVIGVVVLPVAWLFSDPFAGYSPAQTALLLGAGLSGVLGIYLYLLALRDEEASLVVPFWQLIPVFGYGFGWLVLGETMPGKRRASSDRDSPPDDGGGQEGGSQGRWHQEARSADRNMGVWFSDPCWKPTRRQHHEHPPPERTTDLRAARGTSASVRGRRGRAGRPRGRPGRARRR